MGEKRRAFFNGDSPLCPAAGQGVLSAGRPGRVAAKQPVSLSVRLRASARRHLVRELWEHGGIIFLGTSPSAYVTRKFRFLYDSW